MTDIENRKDIELLVDTFYKKVIKDDIIGLFFTQVVILNWEKHMPVMYDFWETMLLGNMVYKGNPMLAHIELSKKRSLEPQHFERWLSLWKKTIDETFTGPMATLAFQKATQIAELMKFKVEKHA
jgi:hemoglobin